MYCIVVMIVYIGTLINSQMESVITIRIALNVENTEIYKLFGWMSLFVLIIFIFFTFSLAFQKYKKGRDMKPFKLIFISALMILIMTNATPISHLNAQANEENKKLKYEK